MDIKPIRNRKDYAAALREIERLFDAKPGTVEGDLLEVWAALVHAYEERRQPVPLPNPIDAILYYMDSRGLTRRDLEKCLGSRARVSEVLNRKRPLTIEMIRGLCKEFGMPAEVLIKPYRTARGAA
ncbi:MAG: DNA-binding protein [Thermodesulfovibrionales bacterium]